MSQAQALLVVAVMLTGWSCGQPAELSLCAGEDSSRSSVRVHDQSEPGQPLVIEGQVWVGKKKTPVAGTRILLYHTNAAGHYARDGSGYPGAYLCSVLRTDEDGRFRIETIRPGPRRGEAGAHVHFDVTAPWGDRVFDAVSLADDPRLRRFPVGDTWEEVRPVTYGDDGVQYVEKNIWLRH
jgi:hypothetical protein